MNRFDSTLSALPLATLLAMTTACGSATPAPESSDDAAETSASQPDELESDATDSSDEAETAADDSESEGAPTEAPDAKNEGVPSKRSMDTIVKVIQDNRHLFRLCYEKVQKEKPELKGDVVVHFRITSEGKVVDAQVNPEGTTLKDENVGSCAANEMKKLTFPKVETGMDTEINYPFNFNPK